MGLAVAKDDRECFGLGIFFDEPGVSFEFEAVEVLLKWGIVFRPVVAAFFSSRSKGDIFFPTHIGESKCTQVFIRLGKIGDFLFGRILSRDWKRKQHKTNADHRSRDHELLPYHLSHSHLD